MVLKGTETDDVLGRPLNSPEMIPKDTVVLAEPAAG